MYPVYFDRNNNYIQFDNKMAIFPDQGGITSNYDKLKIKIDLLSAEPFSYFTIEVHNPDKCNVKSMHLRRQDQFASSSNDYLDKVKIESVFLKNSVAIIDLEYAKRILGLGGLMLADGKLDTVQILEIVFETTKDGISNPGACELRAFAKQIRIRTTTTPTTITTTTSTTTSSTTTTEEPECPYNIGFETSEILTVNESDKYAKIKVVADLNESGCQFKKTLNVKVTLKSQTALSFDDFDGQEQDLIFKNDTRSQELLIKIYDDNLIEPYEFFTVDIPESDAYNLVNPQKVIYIEDNDCK